MHGCAIGHRSAGSASNTTGLAHWAGEKAQVLFLPHRYSALSNLFITRLVEKFSTRLIEISNRDQNSARLSGVVSSAVFAGNSYILVWPHT